MDGGVFWSDKVCAAVIGASTGIGWLSLLLMLLMMVLLPVLRLRRHSARRVILVDQPMMWLVVLLSGDSGILVAHLMVARCSGVSITWHIVLLVAILIVAILICIGVPGVVLVSGSGWLVVLVVAALLVVRPLASTCRVAAGATSVAAARILMVPVVGEAAASVSVVVSSKIASRRSSTMTTIV